MENSQADYFSFDIFIERAFKRDYRKYLSITGAFKTLVETERGNDFTSSAGSYDMQLVKINKNIAKAIIKFLKSKPTSEEEAGLNQLLEVLPNLYHTSDIKELLEKGLIITKRFKEG